MLHRRLPIALVVLSLGCGDDDGPTRPSNGVIHTTASTFKFKPREIALNPGEAVTIRLTSTDMGHTFMIDALNVNVDIPVGDTVSVELTAVSEGSYTFYCAVPGHREQGMEGTLSVTRRPVQTQSSGGGGGGGY